MPDRMLPPSGIPESGHSMLKQRLVTAFVCRASRAYNGRFFKEAPPMKRLVVIATLLLVSLTANAQDMPNGRFAKLAGMQMPAMITREANGIAHVFAFNKHDALFLNGWLHAQDRLWEMDTNRRTAEGTLAELLGVAALPTDIQLRTLGLGRAADATLPTVSDSAKAALQAYTDGVNAYASTHPLPPEYSLLSLTKFAPSVNPLNPTNPFPNIPP